MCPSKNASTSGRVPLRRFLAGESFVDPDMENPLHAWGAFEVMGLDGRTSWAERLTERCDGEAVAAQLDGFLGDLEREASATWGDPEPSFASALDPAHAASSLTALPGTLGPRFDRLGFKPLVEGDRLTGRWVLLLLGPKEDDGFSSEVELLNPGVDGPELEGLLRYFRARFSETFSWDGRGAAVDDEDDDDQEPDAARDATLGSFFPGWLFPRFPEGLELEACWAGIEMEDEAGERCWVERFDPAGSPHLLLAHITRHIAWLEATMIADADGLDERPPGVLLVDVEDADPTLAESPPWEEPDSTHPWARVAPLPESIAGLAVEPLPLGWTPRRAAFYLAVRDADDGSRALFTIEAAAPSSGLEPVGRLRWGEDLGLVRGLQRDLIAHLL